jgi:hypothetical protein
MWDESRSLQSLGEKRNQGGPEQEELGESFELGERR